MDQSPADNPKSRLAAGDYILAIDGKEIGPDATFDALLNRKAGKKVTLLVNRLPVVSPQHEGEVHASHGRNRVVWKLGERLGDLLHDRVF